MNRREWARQTVQKLDDEIEAEFRAQEPTDEQLENMALVLGFPYLPPAMRPHYWRESMLNLHKIVQRSIDGDVEAQVTLEFLRTRFVA